MALVTLHLTDEAHAVGHLCTEEVVVATCADQDWLARVRLHGKANVAARADGAERLCNGLAGDFLRDSDALRVQVDVPVLRRHVALEEHHVLALRLVALAQTVLVLGQFRTKLRCRRRHLGYVVDGNEQNVVVCQRSLRDRHVHVFAHGYDQVLLHVGVVEAEPALRGGQRPLVPSLPSSAPASSPAAAAASHPARVVQAVAIELRRGLGSLHARGLEPLHLERPSNHGNGLERRWRRVWGPGPDVIE
mmetsp:Transcript_1240/g.4447  ORF Transcript_1240/g.4447 Transcript_1240/m.4447 type:complete len:248 (-) Transcript_1240:870-1613(-)